MPAEPACSLCRHYKPLNPEEGTCRAHPPGFVIVPAQDGPTTLAAWPPVEAGDWCGEFAPRPE